jgi:hypothetical protein
LYTPPAKIEFGSGDTVNPSEVAMLHTTPTQAAVDDLEQRGPGAGAIGAGLGIATLLAVVYVGRAEVLMMPALGMIAVTAAVIDARTFRIPNWLTGTGAFLFAVLSIHLVVVENTAWQPIVAGAAIMGGPLLAAHLVSKSRTPGLGDVKLATVLGSPLGAVSPAAAYWALLTGTHDWCRVRTHLPAGDEASGVPAWPSDLASICLDSVRIRSHGLEWGVGAVIAIATDRLLPTVGRAPAHRREELS